MINQYCSLIELLVQGLSSRTNKVFQSRRNCPARNVPCIAQSRSPWCTPAAQSPWLQRHSLLWLFIPQLWGLFFCSASAFSQVNVVWFVPTIVLQMLHLLPRLACALVHSSICICRAWTRVVFSASSSFFLPSLPPTAFVFSCWLRNLKLKCKRGGKLELSCCSSFLQSEIYAEHQTVVSQLSNMQCCYNATTALNSNYKVWNISVRLPFFLNIRRLEIGGLSWGTCSSEAVVNEEDIGLDWLQEQSWLHPSSM